VAEIWRDRGVVGDNPDRGYCDVTYPASELYDMYALRHDVY
jgi:hypothetical protein